DFYDLIDDLEKNFQEKKTEIIENLKELMGLVFSRENLIVSYTADQEGYSRLEKEVEGLKSVLPDGEMEDVSLKPVFENKNEGFQTSGQVQYVAVAGNFADEGYEYTGALRILKVMLSYEYLW